MNYVAQKISCKTELLTEYKQQANSRNEFRVQASRFFSTSNATVADSNDAKKHIQADEYKWFGMLEEIGTC